VSTQLQDESDVYLCLGQPQTFVCKVPKQDSLTRLEWRIDFEHSSLPSEASVTRLFTSADPEGHILRENRPGITFAFNLTSNNNGSSNLVSIMNIIVDDINATAFINNATVNCGDEANQKILHIIEGLNRLNFDITNIDCMCTIYCLGPPASQMSFTQNLMKVQWNAAALADHYIISLSPLINDNESESTFITSNTTIHLPLQHNQDYNVSVMAGNCAGNSTPAKIGVRVGKHLFVVTCGLYVIVT
jgi:hypothetical protein